MSDQQVRIDNLPPTTAGLDRALVILAQSTGCADCEAVRLLGEWDALNIRFLQILSESYGQGDSDFFRNFEPLPIRTGDQAYQQVALL